MSGVIFKETLRRHWRGMLFWGIGIALVAAAQVLTLPDISALKDYARLVSSLPPALIQMMGGGDAAFFATPAGYLASQYYGLALVIFAVYGLFAGLSITTGEEDRGIMDTLLGLPVPRWRLLLERLLAQAVLILGIVVIVFIGTWASVLATPAMAIDTGRLFASTINVMPGTFLVLAFTTLVGTVARRRSLAIGVAALFIIGSYFIDFLGGAATDSLAAGLRVISFYRYYDSTGVMQNGLEWGNILILLVVSAVCVVGTLWCFERRDIAVFGQ